MFPGNRVGPTYVPDHANTSTNLHGHVIRRNVDDETQPRAPHPTPFRPYHRGRVSLGVDGSLRVDGPLSLSQGRTGPSLSLRGGRGPLSLRGGRTPLSGWTGFGVRIHTEVPRPLSCRDVHPVTRPGSFRIVDHTQVETTRTKGETLHVSRPIDLRTLPHLTSGTQESAVVQG